MAERVLTLMADADVIVKTAAVSDYRPVETAPQKIKKHQETMSLTLTRNPDILKAVGERKGGRILVGFAAETEGLEANAAQKLRAKNLDIIAGNLIGAPHSGFQADTNQVTLFFRDGAKEAPAGHDQGGGRAHAPRPGGRFAARPGRPPGKLGPRQKIIPDLACLLACHRRYIHRHISRYAPANVPW